MKERLGRAQHPPTCPFCEVGSLGPFGHNAARCDSCGGMVSGSLLQTLKEIDRLPDVIGRHACECGHPEMRRLPDGIFRCPACGAEVLPVSAPPVAWKRESRSGAYWIGWLDGRYGEEGDGSVRNARLSRFDGVSDREDYCRGHSDGRSARAQSQRVTKTS